MIPSRVVTDPTDGRCASCAYFHSTRFDADKNVIVGDCGAGQYPPVRPETSSCRLYRPAGTLSAAARKPATKIAKRKSYEPAPTTQRVPIEVEVDMDETTFRKVLREVLTEELALSAAPIADRYRGGELVLRAGREGVQDRKIPIDVFFKKIVMLRDRLRVLEQKINSHPRLTDDERLGMQQYITGCYGTLTTFNLLFGEDEDKFVGAGEKD